jgi:hypothetical protein
MQHPTLPVLQGFGQAAAALSATPGLLCGTRPAFQPRLRQVPPNARLLEEHLIGVDLRTTAATSSLHVLARSVDILPSAELSCTLPRHLAIKGWGAGWLPAVLAISNSEAAIVLADDDDVTDTSPSTWLLCGSGRALGVLKGASLTACCWGSA